ncbi:MAG: 16S rRNA (adenine(1518)-N(6)/adenine(1519)-N(6))-dimethyltransferase RsmA [Rickettsiales bacterium]|jgi:16S rRNA (adenine1518-N6/adenine1519-N6)-dimethyltransferase|nr:16S rRNA (adenine(1518)-N(6)/adenine(1519)-N(6))-dimethyltransferase RsmA [Rickettsiales bacterium]
MKDNLPPVSEMMKEAGLFSPLRQTRSEFVSPFAGKINAMDKALGQHFIFDLNITDKIARAVPNLSSANVIEIGPGAGSLTRSLLRCGAKSLMVVEKDKRMLPILERIRLCLCKEVPGCACGLPGMTIVEGDALKLGREFYEGVPAPRAIVSNLPYNVGTELLIGWLKNIDLFDSLTLMFQKEVAERIVARPASAKYGRLSVLAAMHADAKILFPVPRAAFSPPPAVENVVVQLAGHGKYSRGVCGKVEKVSAALFANRRKMVRGAIKGFDWGAAGLTGEERAEDLGIQDFIKIANIYDKK